MSSHRSFMRISDLAAMATGLKLVGSALVALLAVIVLAGARAGAVDIPDGLILVAALAMLARIAIRTASGSPPRVSDPTGRRRHHQ